MLDLVRIMQCADALQSAIGLTNMKSGTGPQTSRDAVTKNAGSSDAPDVAATAPEPQCPATADICDTHLASSVVDNEEAGVSSDPELAELDRPSAIYLLDLKNIQVFIARADATDSSVATKDEELPPRHSAAGTVSDTDTVTGIGMRTPLHLLSSSAPKATYTDKKGKNSVLGVSIDHIRGVVEKPSYLAGTMTGLSHSNKKGNSASNSSPESDFNLNPQSAPACQPIVETVVKVFFGDFQVTSSGEALLLGVGSATLEEALELVKAGGLPVAGRSPDYTDHAQAGGVESSFSVFRYESLLQQPMIISPENAAANDDPRNSIGTSSRGSAAITATATRKTTASLIFPTTSHNNSTENENSLQQSQLVIVPCVLEKLTDKLVVELFRGFGTVRQGRCAWWEDSVFGYLNAFIDRTFGVDPRGGVDVLIPATKAQLAKAEKNRNGEPLVMRLEKSSLVITIAEITRQNSSPTKREVAKEVTALSIALRDTSSTGRLRVRAADDIDPLLEFTLAANIQLLLSATDGEGNITSTAICQPFSFSTDVLKYGHDPVKFRSDISMDSIRSELSISASTKAWSLLGGIYRSLGKSRAIVAAFWCSVESSIPSYHQLYYNPSTQHHTAVSDDDPLYEEDRDRGANGGGDEDINRLHDNLSIGEDQQEVGTESLLRSPQPRPQTKKATSASIPSANSISTPRNGGNNPAYFATPTKGTGMPLGDHLLSALSPRSKQLMTTTPSAATTATTAVYDTSDRLKHHLEYVTPSRSTLAVLGLSESTDDNIEETADGRGGDGGDGGANHEEDMNNKGGAASGLNKRAAVQVFHLINDSDLSSSSFAGESTEHSPVRQEQEENLPLLPREDFVSSSEEWANNTAAEDAIATHTILTDGISRTLLEVYSQLRSLKGFATESSAHVAASVAALRSAYSELEELLGRMKRIALVTVGLMPTLCGWVRRSNGFLPRPPSVDGGKSSKQLTGGGANAWAVLVQNYILFMPRPYGSVADFVLCLEKMFVVDPDEEDISSGQGLDTSSRGTSSTHGNKAAAASTSYSSLSHVIWCVGDDGTFVIDCGTDKTQWLQALSRWVVPVAALGMKGDENSEHGLGNNDDPQAVLMIGGAASVAAATLKLKNVGKGFEDAFATVRSAIRGGGGGGGTGEKGASTKIITGRAPRGITGTGTGSSANNSGLTGNSGGSSSSSIISSNNSSSGGNITAAVGGSLISGKASEHAQRLKTVTKGMMKAFTGGFSRPHQHSSSTGGTSQGTDNTTAAAAAAAVASHESSSLSSPGITSTVTGKISNDDIGNLAGQSTSGSGTTTGNIGIISGHPSSGDMSAGDYQVGGPGGLGTHADNYLYSQEEHDEDDDDNNDDNNDNDDDDDDSTVGGSTVAVVTGEGSSNVVRELSNKDKFVKTVAGPSAVNTMIQSQLKSGARQTFLPSFFMQSRRTVSMSQAQASAAAIARDISAAATGSVAVKGRLLDSPVGLELIDEIEAMTAPLAHVTTLVESAAVHSAELSHEIDFSLRQTLTYVAQSVMGMGTLNILADEIRNHEKDRTAQCLTAVEHSRNTARDALRKGAIITESWTRAEKKYTEQEAVLQACTLQHINTVSAMSRKIYDLEEQNKALRDPEDPAPLLVEGSPAYLQEVIRNLTMTVTDTEKLLLESEEREVMAKEEMESVRVAVDTSHTEVLFLQNKLADLQQSLSNSKHSYEKRLKEEHTARRVAEREKGALQRRLEAALATLNTLGIKEDPN